MGEGALCVDVLRDEDMGNKNYGGDESKRDTEFLASDKEVEAYDKQVKEASNEEIKSEVSNPAVCTKGNAFTTQDITSQLVEMSSSAQVVGCGEATSSCARNLSGERTLTDGEPSCGDNKSSVSHVTLEIPKHVSSTGIRKITFKFRKREDDYDIQSSASLTESISNDVFNYSNNGDLSPIRSCPSHRYLYARNMELKMSKKIIPINYPTNVKKLLATGILDGARVKYISNSPERQLHGIVNGGGYLCGCSSCQFSKILSAFEFEQHAGAKTRHPNNQIFLENGRPIYSIIQEIKSASLCQLDEVMRNVAGSSINEDFFQIWKASLQQSHEMYGADNYSGRLTSFSHYLVSCQDSEESFCATPSPFSLNNPIREQIYMENSVEQKQAVKRPRHLVSKADEQRKKTADGDVKKRDNDLHQLLFKSNGLPNGAELAYRVKGQTLLEGYKYKNGITCRCCNETISPSQFEAHAGMAARRQPYRHIYTSSGSTLHDIAVSLANGRRLISENSSDRCAHCGRPENLIFCNGCPQAFHAECSQLTFHSEGDWLCQICLEKSGHGRKASGGESSIKESPIVIRLTRAAKDRDFKIGGCVICRQHDCSSVGDRRVILCDQCEKEYHVGCLRISKVCDLKVIPKGAWFCCDECKTIHATLKSSISSGAKMIPASSLDTINRKHVENGLIIDGTASDVQFQIVRGKAQRTGNRGKDDCNHESLLDDACAIFTECFAPIKVAKRKCNLVPIMVSGRKILDQDFGGMYCVLLTVKSAVVSAGLLRIFGREVAELPLVATAKKHQGKGYFQALFACIERLLSTVKVAKLVLPATKEAESIWMNRFGFRKMSEEQLFRYQRDFLLVVFKGTSMLEKEVRRIEGPLRGVQKI
ncbi:hypothetical protein HS088_TW03G01300 [Tripterygium wilfordii]|uniref:PHD-type domain-containing protein n=1 Tax=Tripterygium wilfordii TaxID=458696 RepID=A0A7J7DX46_TRIWF|nr:uncharacterized protein LOC119993585 [Tripterygium wilfordii]KAF5750960.1 hypothetical protein HS088_TW03G01300 [Tripterygium wilfordii]